MPHGMSRRRWLVGGSRWLALALAPLALCAVACAKPSAQKLNEDGNHAYARGEYQPALDDYRRAQVARPDLSALNYNAGNALYQQGDYTRAIGEAQHAANSSDPEVAAKAFYSLGEDYYRQGKLQDALDAFKNALRIDPSDHDAKYNVEVIQAQLDREAANLAQIQQQAQQNQQNQQQNQQNQQQNGQNQPGSQNQQGNQNQQPQQGQQGQPNQGGQQQPGQSQPGNQQPGQSQAGQQGQQSQPGQGQPGAAGQTGQQPGQPGQPVGPMTGAGQPGAIGTPGPSPRQQAQELQGELQAAIAQYNQSPSIDQALQILDILAQQEQLAQAQQAGRTPPGVTDK